MSDTLRPTPTASDAGAEELAQKVMRTQKPACTNNIIEPTYGSAFEKRARELGFVVYREGRSTDYVLCIKLPTAGLTFF